MSTVQRPVKGKLKGMARKADKYELYQEAVQDPDTDVDLAARIFRKRYKREARRFREDLRIEGWQNSDSIGLRIQGELHTGDAAWQRLLEIDPHLHGLNWLAAKMGLEATLARTVRSGAGFLRFLCPACRRS